MPAAANLEQLRRERLRSLGPSPLLTFYDLATGERVELSHTTADNWVAKTANLVTDLGVGAGDRVQLSLPPHWQSAVWCLATWAVGAALVDSEPDLLVTGPELSDSPGLPPTSAADLVVCSLRPLGLPCEAPLPPGALDYALEVRGHADRFTGPAPAASSVAIDLGYIRSTHSEVLAAHPADSDPTAGRLMQVDGTVASLADLVVRALVCGGSLVLVRAGDSADPDAISRIAESERVTALE